MPTAEAMLRERHKKLAEELELRHWYSGDPSPETTRRMERELEELGAMIVKLPKKARKRTK